MLPTEPPLSPHRLLAPVPPARPRESAAAAHQVPAPAAAEPPGRQPAKPPTTVAHLLAAGHNQVGNSAVAGAVARGVLAVPVPVALLPRPPWKSPQSP